METAPHGAPHLIARVMLLRGLLSVPAYVAILMLSARYGMPGLGIGAPSGLLVLACPCGRVLHSGNHSDAGRRARRLETASDVQADDDSVGTAAI